MDKRITLLTFLFLSLFSFVNAQNRLTKDNYTGTWEDPNSWSTAYPGTSNISNHVGIYGKITHTGNLSFHSNGDLTVFDTLIVYGDLTMGTNSELDLSENSVLIIYGNLNCGTRVSVSANGTLIVTGNITKSGAGNQGEFTSDQDPPQIYVGGSVDDFGGGDAWQNPGDLDDLQDSDNPFKDLFNESCDEVPELDISYEVSGGIIFLNSEITNYDSGKSYSYRWTGPGDYLSTEANAQEDITDMEEGWYFFRATITSTGCAARDSIDVSFDSQPAATAEIISITEGPVCSLDPVVLGIEITGQPGFSIQISDNNGGTWDFDDLDQVSSNGNIYSYQLTVFPEWYDNGGAVFIEYEYAINSVSDENGDGDVIGDPFTVSVYKIPETGPQYHIPNSFGQ